jgi:hypothetical protein
LVSYDDSRTNIESNFMTQLNVGLPCSNANQSREAVSSVPQATEQSPSSRDGQGRFLAGNNGGGRKKGSRNRLTDTFLAAVETDFAEHGLQTLAKLRSDDPASYLRIVASLLPRDLILKREQEPDYSDLSDDELAEMMWQAWRASQIRQQLDGVKR